MIVEEIRKKKKELGISNAKLSELSGVPIGTVQKIMSGETEAPRYNTILALNAALATSENEIKPEKSVDDYMGMFVTEPQAAYEYTPKVSWAFNKPIGDKTIDDYMALPEGARIELIDGYFYNMGAPTTVHQLIGGEIHRLLKNHVMEHKGKCIPFIAPTDVQIDKDNKTMLQPDVFVVCNRDKITKARVVGAPDFVVEIVSPSNTFTDIVIKLAKYKHAGVREYWIVFPEEKAVMVYVFARSEDPAIYSFDDEIPVAIWDGQCSIDFTDIYEQVEFMYQE